MTRLTDACLASVVNRLLIEHFDNFVVLRYFSKWNRNTIKTTINAIAEKQKYIRSTIATKKFSLENENFVKNDETAKNYDQYE